MLNFKNVTLEDRQKAQNFIEASGQLGADASFANMFFWGYQNGKFDTRIAFDDDFMYRGFFKGGELSHYYLPLGSGDMIPALKKIADDAKERKVSLKFHLITGDMLPIFENVFPDKLEITEMRDKFDYIYNQEDLANLAGRKYHSKRNHISRFKNTNPDYSVKEITVANKSDAIAVAQEWCKNSSGGECSKDDPEFCAIKRAFNNFEALELSGCVLYIEEKPVAMTVASRINRKVLDIHFEKTLPGFESCYAVINNEFAKTKPEIQLINREEDLGLEGLRKSKLSYNPTILLEKFTIKVN